MEPSIITEGLKVLKTTRRHTDKQKSTEGTQNVRTKKSERRVKQARKRATELFGCLKESSWRVAVATSEPVDWGEKKQRSVMRHDSDECETKSKAVLLIDRTRSTKVELNSAIFSNGN
jgi:hypothetical protein